MANQVVRSPVAPAERVRRQGAPVVAFMATSLTVLCTTSLVALISRPFELLSLTARSVGILAFGSTLFLVAAAGSLLLSRRLGAGVPLVVGAVLAAIGLMLGDHIATAPRLFVAVVVTASAAGSLAGGAASMPFELPWGSAQITALGWMTPLLVGWPLQGWAALADTRVEPRIVVPHLAGLGYLAAAIVLVWGVASLMSRAPQAHSITAGWRDPWLAIAGALSMLSVLAMLVGFDASLRLFWLRPVVLVASALALGIWVLVIMLIPSPAAKISFLAVSLVGASIPPTAQLLVAADSLGAGSSGGVASSIVVLVFGAAGLVLGYRHPRLAVVRGFLVVAAAAVLAWPGYGTSWISTPVLGLLVGAAVAVAAGGLMVAFESEAALRMVSFGFLGGLVAGLLIALPLGWALVGDLPLTAASARANARVFLGLLFAAAVLVAAHASVLGRRIDRRLARVPSS